MLNSAEFSQLKNPNLSHLARSLYVFYLKPAYQQGHKQIDLRTLTAQLVSYSEFLPLSPSSEQIGLALNELEQLQLVRLVKNPQEDNTLLEACTTNEYLRTHQNQRAPAQAQNLSQAQVQSKIQSQTQVQSQAQSNTQVKPQSTQTPNQTQSQAQPQTQPQFQPQAQTQSQAPYPETIQAGIIQAGVTGGQQGQFPEVSLGQNFAPNVGQDFGQNPEQTTGTTLRPNLSPSRSAFQAPLAQASTQGFTLSRISAPAPGQAPYQAPSQTSGQMPGQGTPFIQNPAPFYPGQGQLSRPAQDQTQVQAQSQAQSLNQTQALSQTVPQASYQTQSTYQSQYQPQARLQRGNTVTAQPQPWESERYTLAQAPYTGATGTGTGALYPATSNLAPCNAAQPTNTYATPTTTSSALDSALTSDQTSWYQTQAMSQGQVFAQNSASSASSVPASKRYNSNVPFNEPFNGQFNRQAPYSNEPEFADFANERDFARRENGRHFNEQTFDGREAGRNFNQANQLNQPEAGRNFAPGAGMYTSQDEGYAGTNAYYLNQPSQGQAPFNSANLSQDAMPRDAWGQTLGQNSPYKTEPTHQANHSLAKASKLGQPYSSYDRADDRLYATAHNMANDAAYDSDYDADYDAGYDSGYDSDYDAAYEQNATWLNQGASQHNQTGFRHNLPQNIPGQLAAESHKSNSEPECLDLNTRKAQLAAVLKELGDIPSHHSSTPAPAPDQQDSAQSQPQSQTLTKIQTKSQSQTLSQANQSNQSNTVQEQAHSHPQAQNQIQTQGQAPAKIKAQDQTQSLTSGQAMIQPQTQSQSHAQAQAYTQAQVQPKSQVVVETQASTVVNATNKVAGYEVTGQDMAVHVGNTFNNAGNAFEDAAEVACNAGITGSTGNNSNTAASVSGNDDNAGNAGNISNAGNACHAEDTGDTEHSAEDDLGLGQVLEQALGSGQASQDETTLEGPEILDEHDPWRWQGATISLPLFNQQMLEGPRKPFRMYAEWQPGPTLAEAAHNAGLINYSYEPHVLQEFVSYWLNRGDERTQYAWERTFVKRLLRLLMLSDIKERSIFTPNYKKSRKHQFQTLSSITTGIKEYAVQPELEALTRNLVTDGSNTQIAVDAAKAAQNSDYILPPSSNIVGSPRPQRLSPQELLKQLSDYSVHEVEDILHELSHERKFAPIFEDVDDDVLDYELYQPNSELSGSKHPGSEQPNPNQPTPANQSNQFATTNSQLAVPLAVSSTSQLNHLTLAQYRVQDETQAGAQGGSQVGAQGKVQAGASCKVQSGSQQNTRQVQGQVKGQATAMGPAPIQGQAPAQAQAQTNTPTQAQAQAQPQGQAQTQSPTQSSALGQPYVQAHMQAKALGQSKIQSQIQAQPQGQAQVQAQVQPQSLASMLTPTPGQTLGQPLGQTQAQSDNHMPLANFTEQVNGQVGSGQINQTTPETERMAIQSSVRQIGNLQCTKITAMSEMEYVANTGLTVPTKVTKHSPNKSSVRAARKALKEAYIPVDMEKLKPYL